MDPDHPISKAASSSRPSRAPGQELPKGQTVPSSRPSRAPGQELPKGQTVPSSRPSGAPGQELPTGQTAPSSGMLKIAVFDLDGTLLPGTNGEWQLIQFLRRRSLLPVFNFVRGLVYLARSFPTNPKEAVLRNKFYMFGLEPRIIRSVLAEFYEESVRPRLSTRMLDAMNDLKHLGFWIVLISGTLDFIVEDLVKRLGADAGVGSALEVHRGRYTGRLLGIHPYGTSKLKALETVLQNRTVDWAESYGFGDSRADTPFLSLFGHPKAVTRTGFSGGRLGSGAGKSSWIGHEIVLEVGQPLSVCSGLIDRFGRSLWQQSSSLFS
jgi:HAD superfamily hydrolase (TIGR01490 family)